MKNILMYIFCLLLLLMPMVNASDSSDKRIDELSERVEQLTKELNELTSELQKLIKAKDSDKKQVSETSDENSNTSGDSKTTTGDEQIGKILERMNEINSMQKKLAEEVDGLKENNKSEPLYDEDGNEVHLGIVEDSDDDSDIPVLKYYGNANDSDTEYYYEEPEYIEPKPQPKVRVRFYFGRPRSYYDDWDEPWGITPPWWVRRHYYRHHR